MRSLNTWAKTTIEIVYRNRLKFYKEGTVQTNRVTKDHLTFYWGIHHSLYGRLLEANDTNY